jgi:hypothetical protein
LEIMDLKTWVKTSGRGSLKYLSDKTGLSYSTIHRAFRGHMVMYQTALRLSAATDGAVTVAELCDPAATVDPQVLDNTAPRDPESPAVDGSADDPQIGGSSTPAQDAPQSPALAAVPSHQAGVDGAPEPDPAPDPGQNSVPSGSTDPRRRRGANGLEPGTLAAVFDRENDSK